MFYRSEFRTAASNFNARIKEWNLLVKEQSLLFGDIIISASERRGPLRKAKDSTRIKLHWKKFFINEMANYFEWFKSSCDEAFLKKIAKRSSEIEGLPSISGLSEIYWLRLFLETDKELVNMEVQEIL